MFIFVRNERSSICIFALAGRLIDTGVAWRGVSADRVQ
jgi:hypothetical protein